MTRLTDIPVFRKNNGKNVIVRFNNNNKEPIKMLKKSKSQKLSKSQKSAKSGKKPLKKWEFT